MKINTDHSTSPMNHGTAQQRAAHGYTKAFDECGVAMATLGPYMAPLFQASLSSGIRVDCTRICGPQPLHPRGRLAMMG